MVQLNQAFDSGQHGEMQSFDPIPADDYIMQVIESDLCVTKDKKGKFIKLVTEVMQGEFKGRKVWTNLNIVNANPVAVEIANKELAAVCRACGKPVIQDTVELHGIPMKVKLRIKKAKGDYPAQNSAASYEPTGVKPKAKVKPGAKKAAEPVVDGDNPDWG